MTLCDIDKISIFFKLLIMKDLPVLKDLLFELEKLPGIGQRSAQRLVQHLLQSHQPDIQQLSNKLLEVKNKITKCKTCFHITQNTDFCSFCEDSSRNKHVICVVEQAFDIFKIENCSDFNGNYHVLNGVLSPLHQIEVKDLTLNELEKRIKKQAVTELILAIDSDLEGDTTALYIMQNFKSSNLKISRLAQGIPSGSDLSFIDNRTLSQAFENRNII